MAAAVVKLANEGNRHLYNKMVDLQTKVQATERAQGRDAHFSMTVRKALISLSNYPLRVTSAAEAKSLNGVGDRIATEMMKILESAPDQDVLARVRAAQAALAAAAAAPAAASGPADGKQPKRKPAAADGAKPKKPRAEKEYIPRYRSGGFAILVALAKAEGEEGEQYNGTRKAELIAAAKPYCDAPFETSADNHYSARSSMAQLLKKNLVTKASNLCVSLSSLSFRHRPVFLSQ